MGKLSSRRRAPGTHLNDAHDVDDIPDLDGAGREKIRHE
eukprot:CAMPEP_0118883680 /NCGR_PEP_ID=MMETSP1163-20130328/22718_1 /TAXON_ID=124430 /ORGANISM="Phaeomonas parva, Strain CCMP2877" /LENGTH=38 /DNA_ID= /DNA_START= /DNA_END= /DNA_ORIENTATION=